VLGKTLEVWLVPVYIFAVFNLIRFIAEHYEIPWNQGQLAGSRTVTSNPLHSFFWNNINWHIGHHIYLTVPWYNLIELHDLMKSAIAAEGAIVEKSYTGVFLRALVRGPESGQRLERVLAKRQPAIA
jgi:fatty acid desaturase